MYKPFQHPGTSSLSSKNQTEFHLFLDISNSRVGGLTTSLFVQDTEHFMAEEKELYQIGHCLGPLTFFSKSKEGIIAL